MGRIGFFIKEGFRALRRNAAPSVAATVTTAITILVLGVLLPVFFFTQRTSEGVREQLAVKVFLFDDATKQEIGTLRQRIRGLDHVQSVEFVSKAEALTILKQRLKDPGVLQELNSNPLPASFTVKPDDAANLAAVRRELTPAGPDGKPRPISPIVDKVFDARETSNSIEEVTSKLKIVLILLTALLVFASVLLIGNTIRLSIYARRREVEVMRLVGATRWFVRWPFMIEGVLVGVMGGAVAILLLWLGKLLVVDPLADSFTLIRAQTDTNLAFPVLVAVLAASSTIVSAIGSGFTLRRFLKV
jgi:cell division transport system permease protein